MKRLCSLLIILSFSSLACGGNRQAQRGPITPKSFVTPWEYYQSARTAELRPSDEVKVQKTEVHSTGEDTPSDKRNIILIGTLVGVVVVGGTVAGILIAR